MAAGIYTLQSPSRTDKQQKCLTGALPGEALGDAVLDLQTETFRPKALKL